VVVLLKHRDMEWVITWDLRDTQYKVRKTGVSKHINDISAASSRVIESWPSQWTCRYDSQSPSDIVPVPVSGPGAETSAHRSQVPVATQL
jgi:hypothetical protein